MKILFTKHGTPKSGSWLMRGIQIAEELSKLKIADARAEVSANGETLAWADVVIVVKRCDDLLARRLAHLKKPVIWDALDFWRQPDDHTWNAAQAKMLFHKQLFKLNPDGVIFATLKMQNDLGDKLPVTAAIYHHFRFDRPINPIREKIQAIGYEGSARYLEGGWFTAISRACDRRGASFVVNPRNLADVDIVFSVRGDPWRGYQTDNWKSNVKLANAQATGTPFIGLREQGCLETASGAEVWVNEPSDVDDAVRALEARGAREASKTQLLATAPKLGHILEGYRSICSRLAA